MHEFAFYYPLLSSSVNNFFAKEFVIDDEALVHRIVRVVRRQEHDPVIIFDGVVRLNAVLGAPGGKSRLILTQCNWHQTEPRKHEFIFMLPLLKKDDCQQALYSLTEVGVDVIQLVYTKGVHRSWWMGARDIERLERISIAAAEQAKNFIMPVIKPPIELESALEQLKPAKAFSCFFDVSGESIEQLCAQKDKAFDNRIIAMVGPEADLTQEEKNLLSKAGFSFYSLTPTVLRACQAAALGAGLLRSLFNK